jgi:hypothetical protein
MSSFLFKDSRFVLGFVAASVIWGAALLAHSTGLFDFWAAAETGEVLGTDTDSDTAAELGESTKSLKKRGKLRRQRRDSVRSPRGAGYDTGEGRSGDELGTSGARELSMNAGGEEQLSSADIDAGIDRVFNGIQRCLILVQNEAPAVGKVVVGMKIAPSGTVTSVNLSGPNVIIKGDCGACIRRAVKSIRYRSFSGPEMIVQYPIVFD